MQFSGLSARADVSAGALRQVERGFGRGHAHVDYAGKEFVERFPLRGGQRAEEFIFNPVEA